MNMRNLFPLKISIIFLLSFQFLPAASPKECDEMIVAGISAMNERQHSHSLEILSKAQRLARENGWHRQEFLALNNIGANFYRMLDYGEALNNYLEGYKVALMHLDYKSEMTVLNNIAILYSEEKKFNKSEEYFQKAYELAHKSADSVKIGIYAINRAAVANETGRLKKAQRFLDEAFSVLKNNNLLLQAKLVQAENLVLLKSFTEAEILISDLLPKLRGVVHRDNRILVFTFLADIAKNKNKPNEALSYYHMALAEKPGLDKKESLFRDISTVYERKNNMKYALMYRDSVLHMHDSVNALKNGRLFENSTIKFELRHSQKTLADSHRQITHERILFTCMGGLILMMILGMILYFRNKNRRMKQERLIEENTKKIIALELEQEKKDRELLQNRFRENEMRYELGQEKLKNEIEAKNRKLMVKVLQLTSKNELIQEVASTLQHQLGEEEIPEVAAAVAQLQRGLRREDEQSDFLRHFEDVNSGFLERLRGKHPSLTSNDLRFISYVFMNLSSKEISALLNITLEACRKRKERIARKMDLPKDNDLFSYISTV